MPNEITKATRADSSEILALLAEARGDDLSAEDRAKKGFVRRVCQP